MAKKRKKYKKCDKLTSKACASCPFRVVNFKEFGAVAKALSKKHGLPEPDFFQVVTVRQRIMDEAIATGSLACHSSIYNNKMNADVTGATPCIGLLEIQKACGK